MTPTRLRRTIPHRAKAWLAFAAVRSGATRLTARRHASRLRILMYHGVVERLDGPSAFGNLFVGADAFARHLRYLQRRFQVISLRDALDHADRHGAFPERALAVTFDDGYRNILTMALPILRDTGVPATVFVPAAHVGGPGWYWFDALRVLITEAAQQGRALRVASGWTLDSRIATEPERVFLETLHQIDGLPRDERREIAERLVTSANDPELLARHPEFALAGWDEWRSAIATGLISLGSHGLRHEDLLSMDPAERLPDLRESKAAIEREIGASCESLAYPHGRWDADIAAEAAQAGYRCAVTTNEGLNHARSNRLGLHRTMIGDKGDFHLFCARVTGLWSRLPTGQAS